MTKFLKEIEIFKTSNLQRFWRVFLNFGILSRVILLLSFTLSFVTARAATLQDMDQVLTKASNLNEFLASPTLVEEYYQVSSEYYGASKFPRVSYDAILAQMKTVVHAYPEFAERAWESHLGEHFQVISIAPAYGRNLQESAWDHFLAGYKEKLHSSAGDLAALSDEEALQKVQSALQGLGQKIADHEKKLNSSDLKKTEKQTLTGTFYQSLKSDAGLQKISSYLLLKWLNSAVSKEVFESGNPDLILNYLKEIKDHPKKILHEISQLGGVDSLASFIKNASPDIKVLMKDETIFPQKFLPGRDGKMIPADAGSAGAWDFIPAPRRFHAFFKGIYFGECVGGSSRPEYLTSLTPERWASVILKDTQFHYIEKGGIFQGWVQAVPITQNGQAFASVDFASYSFKQSIIDRNKEGDLYSTSMLSGWLKQAMLHKPKQWKGFIASQSIAINNGGALPTVRISPAFLLGERYDPKTHPFAHADPNTVNILTKIIPRVSYAKNYGGSMIFDAAVPDAGVLTELKVIDKTFHQILKKAVDENDRNFINETLQRVHNGAMSDIGNEILTLRAAGVLKLLADHNLPLPKNVVHYTVAPMEYFKTLVDAGLSLEEMKYAQALICHTVDDKVKFTAALLNSPLIIDGESVVKAINYEIPFPSDDYKNELTKYIETVISKIAEQHPNMKMEHFSKLENMMSMIYAGIAVIDVGMGFVRSSSEFLELCQNAFNRGNDDYKKNIGWLVGANIEIFLSKSPSSEDYSKLANNYSIYWDARQQNLFILAAQKQSDIKKDPLGFSKTLTNKSISAQFVLHHIDSSAAVANEDQKKDLLAHSKEALEHLNVDTGWEKAFTLKIRLTHSVGDLVEELTTYPSAASPYSEFIANTTKEYLPQLLAMNPSYEQLKQLLEKGKFHPPEELLIMKATIDRSASVKDFLKVFEITLDHWKWNLPFLKQRQALLEQNAEKMKSMPNFLDKIDLILKLQTTLAGTMSSTWLHNFILSELLQRLQQSSSPTEWINLLYRQKQVDSEKYQIKINELAKQNYKYFIGLNPSREQKDWYKSTFFKLHERIALKFVKPEYRGTQTNAPRCETIFRAL